MNEIWRDIKDYEGLYQVSNLGRVRSLDHYVKSKGGVRLVKSKIIKQELTKGYLRVILYKDGISSHYLIHRLVAMTFPDLVDWTEDAKGKPFEVLQVNHKDEIKTNNCVDNLEWCNSSYNINYGTRNDKMTIKLSKPVLQYTLDMVFVAEYPSTQEASRQTGICQSSICSCCRGLYGFKTAGGYIWKYADN